jgi:hypothetical protein
MLDDYTGRGTRSAFTCGATKKVEKRSEGAGERYGLSKNFARRAKIFAKSSSGKIQDTNHTLSKKAKNESHRDGFLIQATRNS